MSMARAQQLAANIIVEVLNGCNLNEILITVIQQHPELSASD